MANVGSMWLLYEIPDYPSTSPFDAPTPLTHAPTASPRVSCKLRRRPTATAQVHGSAMATWLFWPTITIYIWVYVYKYIYIFYIHTWYGILYYGIILYHCYGMRPMEYHARPGSKDFQGTLMGINNQQPWGIMGDIIVISCNLGMKW